MSSNIKYKEKYLKYKSKYLKFKNYIGGANGTEVKVLIILNGIKQEPFFMKVLPTDTILNLRENKIPIFEQYLFVLYLCFIGKFILLNIC